MIGKPLFYTGTFCVVLIVAMIVATRSALNPVKYEVVRLHSPDGSREAVVLETPRESSSTSPGFNYRVLLRRVGAPDLPVALLAGARRSRCADGVNARWVDDRHLAIEYLDALSVRSAATVAGVTVTMVPGRRDTAAPAGAMHAPAGTSGGDCRP